MLRNLILLMIAAWLPIAAAAAPPLVVDQAWIRLLPGNGALAGYCQLTNHGDQPLRIDGASSPAFKHVMLHQTVHSNGNVTMLDVDSVEIQPGATLAIAPGGYHFMLLGRNRPLSIGDQVPISVHLDGRTAVDAMFKVRGINTP